jgi:tape measure domain-containing protein
VEGGDLSMSSIDQRVVEMQFDNKAFGAGVSKTIGDLNSLKNGLKLEGAAKGLQEVSAAANRFSMGSLGKQFDNALSHINVWRIAAVTAIATVTNQAVHSAERLVSSLTIDPIKQGFSEYELLMKSTQTILANTARYGTKLPEVQKNLDELNTYADKTIYDFGQMTANIGLFTNAGIRIGDATSMIKGFSNEAAASGTSAEGAASAAYQLSQALSAGTIRLMDWRSLQNVGMGNKNMQDSLIQIADAMGTVSKHGETASKIQANFNGSLEKGWLTADVMSKYLKIMAGDMTVAQMKTLGLSAAQIKSFQAQQKTAEDAATKVRTFTQLIGTVREAVGSGWTDTFRILFGDFNQATELFTGLNNVIGGFVSNSANARNKVLKDWARLGGRAQIIDAIKTAFQALMDVITPIRNAFREIFPATTGKDLYNMSIAIHAFAQGLLISGKTADNIKRTFAGLFAVLDIGWQLIKAGIGFIAELIGHFSKGGGSILNFTGNIGDFLVSLDKAIKQGDIFNKFFDRLAHYVEMPIDALKRFLGYIFTFIGSIRSMSATQGLVQRISSGFKGLSDAGTAISKVWDRVKIIFAAIWQAIQPIMQKIGDATKTVVSDIAGFVAKINFKDVLQGAGIGAFIALVLKIRKTIDNLFNKKEDKKPGIFDAVKESLEQLTSTLKQMQKVLKAATLLEIAGAIIVLTIAVSVLSKINTAGLIKSVSAIAVMVTILTGAMVAMDKLMGKAKAIKMDLIAAGMILFAAAIDILASAVKKMASLSWNDLAKGLAGVVILVGAIVGAVKLMPEQSKMISTGVGLMLIAEAVKILVNAVQTLGNMSWESVAKGLVGTASMLTALALYTRFSRVSSIGDGTGLLLMAAAIKVLASAMKDIAGLSWEQIAKGLVGIAGGLAAMTIAVRKMPAMNLRDSVALIAMAGAMKILASAMKDMSGISWNGIAKGLVGLGGAMFLINMALAGMEEGLPGAAALIIASAALKILASAMQDMGGMSWSDIGKSLVVLAGSLTILVAALAGMEEGLPGAAALVVASLGLKALAAAMVTMGGMSWSDIAAAIVALGGGLLVLAVGLTAMIIALPGALALAVAAPALAAFGLVMTMFGNMDWSTIGKSFVVMGGLFAVLAIGGALSPLILALGASLVVLGGAFVLFGGAVALIGDSIKRIADGLNALGNVHTQVFANISKGIDLLIGKIPRFAAAMAMGVVSFVRVLGNNASTFGSAASKLIDQMIKVVGQKMPQLVRTMASGLLQMLTTIANNMPKFVQRGADIIVSFLNGLAKNMGRIVTAGTNALVAFLNGVRNNLPRIIQAGVNLIISFVNGVANAIRNNSKRMSDAGWNLASAIITGMANGITGLASHVWNAVKNLANGAINQAHKILDSHSPSKEFIKIGHDLTRGFAIGITGNSQQIHDAVQGMFTDIDNLTQKSKQRMIDAAQRIKDLRAANTENAKQIQEAQKRLTQAQNRIVTGKSASARQSSRNAKNNAIDAAEAQLRRLLNTRGKNVAAIAAEKTALANATAEYKKGTAAHKYLQYQLDDEYARQLKLAKQNDILTQKISDAKQVLTDATKTRDDYNKSLQDQYGAQQAIAKDTSLNDYVKNLQQQIVDTQKFSIAIQELRKRGLNNEMYQQLLGTGLDAMPFMQQLLAGGKSAVDNLNTLGKSLDTAAAGIGKSASSSLYQAAVDSAAGLVKGLQNQQKNIEKQMDRIADYMVARMKTMLRIKSPSEVFAELGAFTAQGMAQGLEANATAVGRSAEVIGNTAIDSMKKTIAGLGSAVNGDMDMNPVISPVLDLSNVQKGASQIGSMLASKPLTVDTTKARDASAAYAANQRASTAAATAEPPAPLTFIQNNMSPKALSRAEIYRQTNNQISRAKGALTSNARPS